MRTRQLLVLLASSSLASALGGCGDDTASGAGGGGGSGGASSSAATSTSAPSSVSSSAASTTTASSSSTTSSSSTGGEPACDDDFVPSAETIDFAVLGPLPDGEQIVFNDWNALPNTVASIPPSGGEASPVFEAFRVWSMAVSGDGDTIAFSSGDPEQLAHFGTSLGDAIQHTFLFDVQSEQATTLTCGNINDECHQFSDDGSHLYLCRRSNFRQEGGNFLNDGYYVGRVDLGASTFARFLPPSDESFVLGAQPNGDETNALVQWIDLPNARSIRRLDLATEEVETLREGAGFPVRSPDGASYLYSDYGNAGSLWVSSEGGGDEVMVVDRQASNARWSPDGSQVAYLLWDDAAVCSHIEVVAADGSEADSPTRIRDCADTGEFISDLAWITR